MENQYVPWTESILEFFASAAYTYVSCVAAVASGSRALGAQSAGYMLVAVLLLTFQLTGGHVNPIFTFGMLVTKEIRFLTGLLYMVAQFLGAYVGAMLCWASVASGGFKDPFRLGAQVVPSTFLGRNYAAGYAFVLSMTASFFLAMVYYALMVHRRRSIGSFGPLGVGLCNLALLTAVANITGATLNPARALAPATITAELTDVYIALLAPFIGSGLAMYIYKAMYVDNACIGCLGGRADDDTKDHLAAKDAFLAESAYSY